MQRRCRILRAPRQALQCVLPPTHAFGSVPCQRIGALEGTSLAFVPLPCPCVHDAWFFASFPFVDAPRASPIVVVLLCPLLVVQDGPWRLNPRGRPLPFPGSFPFKRTSKPGSNPVAFPFQRVLKGRGVGAGATDVHHRPSQRAHAWIGVATRARTRSRHGGGSTSAHVAERAGPDLAEMDLRRRKGAWQTRHGGVDEDPGDGS